MKRVASATRFFRYIYFIANKALFVIFITILIFYYLLNLQLTSQNEACFFIFIIITGCFIDKL
ncbi:hypothetical protein G3B30_003021 [Salmonella enterica subsp. enterica]|nr:hypothetical protein [Salmonella enterica subsp. enterica]EEG5931312.1 hypothetical protein [Salmonella enterica subsp. enterica]EEG6222616.1 hypothetical protein [Salmonella enterica subsp. enterica]EEH7309097.1 hypothetical protein [Salmonella enterica subsp. enterica]EEI3390783.1 hypothetical protein [Salmonella enterica subsp. enterica]